MRSSREDDAEDRTKGPSGSTAISPRRNAVGTGVAMCRGDCQDGGVAVVYAGFGAGIGALFGALADSLKDRPVPVFVAPGRATATLTPVVVARGGGARVSVTW